MNEPSTKRQKREIDSNVQCQGFTMKGKRCVFQKQHDDIFCKFHKKRKIDVSTNNVSTNTEGTMLDITTANEVIFQLLSERNEYERVIEYYENKEIC